MSIPVKQKLNEGVVKLSGSAFHQLALLFSGRVKITEKLAEMLARMKEGRQRGQTK